MDYDGLIEFIKTMERAQKAPLLSVSEQITAVLCLATVMAVSTGIMVYFDFKY